MWRKPTLRGRSARLGGAHARAQSVRKLMTRPTRCRMRSRGAMQELPAPGIASCRAARYWTV